LAAAKHYRYNGVMSKELSAKSKIALDFLDLADKGEVKKAFEKHVTSSFKHHNPRFKGDRDSMIDAMERTAKDFPNLTAKRIRVIEDGNIIEKSSDDGEPSGTAGAPMLNILQKNNLANVLIIVTRYFGGILLGTGGLVRAYSASLLQAIDKCSIIKKCFGEELEIELEYSELENFKYYCRNNKISIVDFQYKESIICKIELEEEVKQKLIEDFKSKKVNLKNIKELSKKYITKSI
jgi:uncharacterized YigZ family protein